MTDWADARAEAARIDMLFADYAEEIQAWAAAAREVVEFHNCHCPGHLELEALLNGEREWTKP